MKKPYFSGLLMLTVLFIGFTLGFFLGTNRNQNSITVSVPKTMQTAPPETTSAPSEPEETEPAVTFPININTADKETFMALPGIGETFAERIIRYREEHGEFKSVMDLMNVEGIGEKRMEEILDLITIGG